ncbi:MAG: SgcJ/EcaC family oxidoreductase [Caulobacterales bacterium]|nr:SgcJ/EcaC family oxidoreductase [Caulobacterales bacterium]
MFECLAMEVVDAQIAAWRARDTAAFVEFYAPDAVIVMGPGEDDTLQGGDAIRTHYANAFLEMPADTHLEIANRITSGEYIVDEEAISAGGFAGEVVAICRVQSCQITHVQFLPWVNHEEGVAE